MTTTPTYLAGYRTVLDAFGYWPSFHDAKVRSFEYSEVPPGKVEFVVHGFEMTSEVDAGGYFKLVKHHLVRFTFDGISDVELEPFAKGFAEFGQILGYLGFPLPDGSNEASGFRVLLDSVMEGDGSFTAKAGAVLEVVPCNSDGERLQPV